MITLPRLPSLNRALPFAFAAAALAYDPSAPAAACKRTLFLLLALALLARAASRLLTKARAAPGVSPALVALAGFVLFEGLSLSWSASPGYLTVGSHVAALALAWALSADTDARVIRQNTALFIGSGASLWCVGAFILGARGFDLHAGQGNPDWLGLLLALTLPFSVHAFANVKERHLRALALLSTGLQVVALFLAHSRVAWLASVVGLAVWGATRARNKLRFLSGFALSLGLALTLVTLAEQQPLSSDNPAAESFAGRVWLAETTLQAATNALPLGTGLGGFAAAYLDTQGTRLAKLSPDTAARTFVNATTAHGDFAEIVCETGPLGLLLFLVALVFAVRQALQSKDGVALACLVTAAITMLGDSPLHQPACVLVLFLCLAQAPSGISLSRTTHRIGTLALLLAAALLLRESASDWWAQRLVTGARDAPLAQQTSTFAKAARIAPRSGEVAFALGEARLEAGDPQGAYEAFLRSEALLPSVATNVALGNTLLALNRGAEAQAAYQKAVRRSPGSLRAQTNLAALLLDEGRLDEAEKHLLIARDLSPGHAKVRALQDALSKARIERGASGDPAH